MARRRHQVVPQARNTGVGRHNLDARSRRRHAWSGRRSEYPGLEQEEHAHACARVREDGPVRQKGFPLPRGASRRQRERGTIRGGSQVQRISRLSAVRGGGARSYPLPSAPRGRLRLPRIPLRPSGEQDLLYIGREPSASREYGVPAATGPDTALGLRRAQ
ncbi:unnamed protein product [Hapterophycus canaliculatus]